MLFRSNVTKRYDDILAIDHISAEMKSGSVFGLVGSNGAGKSTFLRLLAGILRPEEGQILIDGEPVWENAARKESFFYISDEQHFFQNATPVDMMNYYAKVYPRFDKERVTKLLATFELDGKRKINTFSKGMKKQLSVILGVSAKTDYIFCDETFDGLDPVMRQTVKSLFASDMAERALTPVIASHNLRELEDICDHVGLLHKGGVLFSRDLEDMKLGMSKAQAVFQNPMKREDFQGLDIIKFEQRGSMYTITARAGQEEMSNVISAHAPIFFETLPLSLEEIFISETEVAGYDIKSLLQE